MSDAAIVKRSPLDFLENRKFIDKVATAIPNAMLKPERFLQLAITLIKSNKLIHCTPISLMSCVMEAAQLGLELDPVLGHIYMVPFKDEATLIIGYKGFAQLMYQSGQVVGISAEIVRAKDKFKRTLGNERKLIHDPAPIPHRDHYQDWRGAYATVRMINGYTDFEYMEAEEIFAVRQRSQSWRKFEADGKPSPWDTDAEPMWEKTPLRRIAKRMPRSTTDNRGILLRAVMIDEYSERKGLLKPTESGFVIEEDFLPAEAEPPLQPTLEKQLQDSIDVVEEKKAAGRKGGKPPREKKKPPKEEPKASAAPGPVKANIPPAAKIDDPVITVSQQTAIFHAAMQAGWKVPEEFNVMLEKKFKIKTIREARNSQFAELLAIAKGDRS